MPTDVALEVFVHLGLEGGHLGSHVLPVVLVVFKLILFLVFLFEFNFFWLLTPFFVRPAFSGRVGQIAVVWIEGSKFLLVLSVVKVDCVSVLVGLVVGVLVFFVLALAILGVQRVFEPPEVGEPLLSLFESFLGDLGLLVGILQRVLEFLRVGQGGIRVLFVLLLRLDLFWLIDNKGRICRHGLIEDLFVLNDSGQEVVVEFVSLEIVDLRLQLLTFFFIVTCDIIGIAGPVREVFSSRLAGLSGAGALLLRDQLAGSVGVVHSVHVVTSLFKIGAEEKISRLVSEFTSHKS